MKTYLSKLATDYDKALELLASPEGEQGQIKITGRLMPGAKCAWAFNDDVEFWRTWNPTTTYPHPKDWPYQGYIIPFPETNGRGEMDAEHVCLVVVDYPIEKENPVTDWGTLANLLSMSELHRFYVFENVTTAQPQLQ